MAKKNDKKKDAKKRMDISMVAVSDNIVFSKTDMWGYYRLTNSAYDFLSSEAKIALGQQIINAFVNLMGDRSEPLSCHLVVSSIPVDIDSWERQVYEVTKDWNKKPTFEDYIRQMYSYLRYEEFMKKVTYLGVHLGKRGALNLDVSKVFENGIESAKNTVKKVISQITLTPDNEISSGEELEARRLEDKIFRTLSNGHLRAERCTAEEILLNTKRQFYPAMQSPNLDVDHENRFGPGDLDLELGSAIFNKLRYLRINQIFEDIEVDGYRATLSISKLPKTVDYPYSSLPFMYFLTLIGLPFTCYSRFEIHPSAKMKKELEKKKKETKDEFENLENSNTADSALGMLPQDVQDSLQDMQILNEMLNDEKAPWIQGTYRIVVETTSEEALKKYCSIVKQQFTDLDINVNWTIGDQADLFLEQMPGDRLRSKSHQQVTNLAMLGTSGFNFSSDVGDDLYDAIMNKEED